MDVTFYRIGEENEMAEYRTYRAGATYKDGVEMPSHDWYQVLNTGKCKGFHIKGEIVNE